MVYYGLLTKHGFRAVVPWVINLSHLKPIQYPYISIYTTQPTRSNTNAMRPLVSHPKWDSKMKEIYMAVNQGFSGLLFDTGRIPWHFGILWTTDDYRCPNSAWIDDEPIRCQWVSIASRPARNYVAKCCQYHRSWMVSFRVEDTLSFKKEFIWMTTLLLMMCVSQAPTCLFHRASINHQTRDLISSQCCNISIRWFPFTCPKRFQHIDHHPSSIIHHPHLHYFH